MDMQEQLRKIQEEAANQLENVRDKAGLDALRLKMLGKKGRFDPVAALNGAVACRRTPEGLAR